MIGEKESRFVFKDPRFRMSNFGRRLVRIITSVFQLFVVVFGVTGLLSDVLQLRFFSILVLLMAGDAFLHSRRSSKNITDIKKTGPVNLVDFCSPEVVSRVEDAYSRASTTKSSFYLELMLVLLGGRDVGEVVRRLEVDPKVLKDKLKTATEQSIITSAGKKETPYSQVEIASQLALKSAIEAGHIEIGAVDFFAGLWLVPEEGIARTASLFNISFKDAVSAGKFVLAKKHSAGIVSLGQVRHQSFKPESVNRAWTSRPTPTLDKYGMDFTDAARLGYVGFMVGHQMEYGNMLAALSRSVRPNVLLVGDNGVGKETMVTHLAFEIAQDNAPKELFDRRVVALDVAAIAAAVAPEEGAMIMKKIAEEIILAQNIVLYIPDIHNLFKIGEGAYLSAADALLPIISSDSFPVIGTTYPNDYSKLLEKRSEISGSFEVIRIAEIDIKETEEVLIYESVMLEEKEGITITLKAISAATELASKYLKPKPLPGSAQELLRDAAVGARRSGVAILDYSRVVEVVSSKTNIPIKIAEKGEAAKVMDLEKDLSKQVIGQPEAISAVASAIKEYRAGLARKGGPIASFLFVGPTGVGKTETAKALSRVHFGSEGAMVRYDMSEFQTADSLARFIGAADGSMPGALTERIIQRPYSLILLDEFEKAHPDILNLFLQVLDDGRMSDGGGRLVNFENCIIIATSNANAKMVVDLIERDVSGARLQEEVKNSLVQVFRPELINRFSRVVVFSPLSQDSIKSVTKLLLNSLSATLLEQGITVNFEESLVEEVSRLGYDPVFGARPLRKVISEKIKTPLAEGILKGQLARGSVVSVGVKDGEISIFRGEGA